MSQRSKNLLEAFNQSKAPEKSAEPVAPPRGSAPRVGGPFADSAPARSAAQQKLYDARPSTADVAQSPRQRWRVVGLCVLIAVIFFFVGKASAPSVQAANTTPTDAPGTVPNAPAAAITTPPKSGALGNDEALKDPANQSTILAITYSKVTPANEELATATAAHFISQGLPASVYRNPTKKQIYVLVGAARVSTDLDAMLVKVKAANSDRGKKEFTTAQHVAIDSYVDRKTR